MSLQTTLYLVAGVGAVILGGGMLLREPGRARNRYFALLCLALAVWTLGAAGRLMPQADPVLWRRILLLGSCAAAPLALHFALVLTPTPPSNRRRLLAPAYALAALLWLVNWLPVHIGNRLWAVMAISVIGGILAVALGVIARYAAGLPSGPARRAHLLVLAGGIVGVAGGMSDFIPRSGPGFLHVGPLAVLVFLLLLCGVVARHRFLDVDALLVRAVALLAGAAATGLVFFCVIRLFDDRFLTLFLAALAVLLVAGPVGKVLLSGARTLLGADDPLTPALAAASRRLAGAESRAEVWRILEDGRRSLRGDVRFEVHVQARKHEGSRRIFRGGGAGTAGSADGPGWDALPRLFAVDGLPVTRRYLEQEARERAGARRQLADAALSELERDGVQLAAPLLHGERLLGWVTLGGDLDDRHLTADAATAFLAVGHQAMASLERIEAIETAKRKEALAAVGELAAGLAHEVRNPVAAIRGAAEALGPRATDEQRGEMLEVIAQESARLDRVVGEFLAYARPASPRREPVDLDALIRRSLLGFEVSGRKLVAELRSDPQAPPALGDPDQLQRAVDNLVRNAWEATGDGGRLRIEIGAEPGSRVTARFEDDGPGIPDDRMASLFRPFVTTKPGGTGLGLALIERIVSAHDGEIRVDGRPGLGAAFTLVLPAAG